LKAGINTVSRAIPVKSAYPILSNILIETENGRLKLAATNQDTTISTYVGASIDKEGRITLPAKTLKELIANLAQGTLNAHLLNETLHITADKSKSKLNGTSADEFPKLPTFSKENPHLEIAPKDFANAVSSVAFAAATDDSRPIFTGVYFSYDNETLTIAASDGFRLSEKTIPVKGNLPKAAIIIPAKTILEVSKIESGKMEIENFINPESKGPIGN
jgi:DNA polymerase-3 subunit beta